MKLGLSAGPNTIALAKETNIKGVPLNFTTLAEQGLRAAMKPIEEAGMEVCQIMAFSFNPLSPERAKQEKQRQMLEQAIAMAPETGCPILLINGGNYDPSGFRRGHGDNFTEAALDHAARELAPVARLAESHGARLAIEPFIQCVVHSPERFLALQEKVGSPALTLNLDLCNFFTYEDMWRPKETAERICQALAGQYVVVHAKDLIVSEGVHIHIDETPLGAGVTDWDTALRFIAKDLPADGYVVVEHAKTAEAVRMGVQNIRLAAQRAGVRFVGE